MKLNFGKMQDPRFIVHDEIELSETLDADFYTDKDVYNIAIEKIFTQTWQYIADRTEILKQPENLFPITLLEKSLDEAVLLVNDGDEIQCISNICTHRGFKLIHHPCKNKKIHCGYHGRRFGLDGSFEFMPEFADAENFPRPCDSLPAIELFVWKRFIFAGLSPKVDQMIISQILDERIGFMNMEQWRFAPEYSKTYGVKANWALYVDNYLEGFHIPFVHQELGQVVDYGEYTTKLYDHAVLQIGYGMKKELAFDLPLGHPDEGRFVSAYYYWLFPNFMLNIYKWGVQINVVKPMSVDFCKVDFFYYIADEDEWEKFGKDALAEKVEREDEFVVEAVQKGVKSKLYKRGRFSPKREKGVHHFHKLISHYLE